MARIRSIHFNACKSEKLQAASAEAERCYWRLLPHCDDEGRAEDDARNLRSEMFPIAEPPLPASLIDTWLQELHDLGLIIRYVVDGIRYLVVTRWHDFQKPQHPKASLLPPHDPSCVLMTPLDTASEPHEASGAVMTPHEAAPDCAPVVVVGEGVVEVVGEGAIAPKRRAPDPMWDAIVDCWRLVEAELTSTERARLNKACKLLRDVEADPREIPRRRATYRTRYRDAADTPMAIAGRWSELRSQDNGQTPKLPAGSEMTARNLARMQEAQ